MSITFHKIDFFLRCSPVFPRLTYSGYYSLFFNNLSTHWNECYIHDANLKSASALKKFMELSSWGIAFLTLPVITISNGCHLCTNKAEEKVFPNANTPGNLEFKSQSGFLPSPISHHLVLQNNLCIQPNLVNPCFHWRVPNQ